MKQWLFLIALFFTHLAFALPLQDHPIDRAAVLQLAASLNLPQDADLVSLTQKHWLRKPNQERWEMAELTPDQKMIVLNWAEEQGLYGEWKPFSKNYDKALILGATTSRMQKRLDFLKQLWNEGVRFNEIVWLTGERPLDPRVDGLMERCSNESEAARILWQEAALPEEMQALPILFIAVPMKGEGGALKRPNTADTIAAWLELSPEPCSALFVSDQPFCWYQFSVVKAALPNAFLFDLAGRGVDPKSHPSAAAITLDTVARCLYQESLCQP